MTPPTSSRTVHLNEAYTVQTEPLLADEWVDLLDTEGRLTTVIAVDHDEFAEAVRDYDTFYGLLATTQAAHTEAYWLDWRIVGADGDDVFVRVANDLREWATVAENVESYNAEVAADYRLTEERLAALRVRD